MQIPLHGPLHKADGCGKVLCSVSSNVSLSSIELVYPIETKLVSPVSMATIDWAAF